MLFRSIGVRPDSAGVGGAVLIAAACLVLGFVIRGGLAQVQANMLLAATAVAWAGYAWFQKTRKGFADVL